MIPFFYFVVSFTGLTPSVASFHYYSKKIKKRKRKQKRFCLRGYCILISFVTTGRFSFDFNFGRSRIIPFAIFFCFPVGNPYVL